MGGVRGREMGGGRGGSEGEGDGRREGEREGGRWEEVSSDIHKTFLAGALTTSFEGRMTLMNSPTRFASLLSIAVT